MAKYRQVAGKIECSNKFGPQQQSWESKTDVVLINHPDIVGALTSSLALDQLAKWYVECPGACQIDDAGISTAVKQEGQGMRIVYLDLQERKTAHHLKRNGSHALDRTV